MRRTWLRRWSWFIIVAALACALSALATARLLPDRYSAESIVIVPASSAGGPGEATNLATSYADLIPADRTILAEVARKIGRDSSDVYAHAAVTNDFNTSILRLSFSDRDPRVAISGARFLAQAVTGPTPVSPRIAPNSLAVVHLPTQATSRKMSSTKVAALGVILGVALAIVLILIVERTNGWIDDVEKLAAEAGCAASSLDQPSDRSIAALLDRWAALGGTPPVRVALFPVSEASERAASAVAERFSHDTLLTRLRAHRLAGTMTPQHDKQVVVEVGEVPGGESAAETLALNADVDVLVAVKGTRVADVRKTVSILEQFGARPAWALLVPSSQSTSRQAPVRTAQPVTSARTSESQGRRTSLGV
jgi:capsular polysaccharide biosynthesis protein